MVLNLFDLNDDKTKQKLIKRGVTKEQINLILELDKKRKQLQHKFDTLSNKLNKQSRLVKSQPQLKEQLKELSLKIKTIKAELTEIKANLKELILQLPNIFSDNLQEHEVTIIKKLDSEILKKDFNFDYLTLLTNNKFIELKKTTTTLSQTRFVTYTFKGAKLLKALICFLLNFNQEAGFKLMFPPLLVNPTPLITCGQLPKFKDDLYQIQDEHLYLIPTAEPALIGLFSNSTLNEQELPIRLTAYTPCFRKEAGSYGKETKGILRLHQFNKVEVVSLCKPEDSQKEFEKILKTATSILDTLQLPYKVVQLPYNDFSFASFITYDILLYLPYSKRFLEISSISNCLDFQAKRGNIKYKTKDNKKYFLHTLNGSSLAIDRLIAAIAECYQTKEGNIQIPKALLKYLEL